MGHCNETYRRVSALSQDPLSRSRGQRLGTGHDAIGAVDDTPSAGERDEFGVRVGVDSSCAERHLAKRSGMTVRVRPRGVTWSSVYTQAQNGRGRLCLSRNIRTWTRG